KMRGIMRKFDHLIFYAEKYRDIDFARANGLTDFSILPNGADEREFATEPDPEFPLRLGIPDSAFVFLTVGSPIAMKGHREVVEAFARMDIGARSATLILNGSWPLPPVYRQLPQWLRFAAPLEPFILPPLRAIKHIASGSWRVIQVLL